MPHPSKYPGWDIVDDPAELVRRGDHACRADRPPEHHDFVVSDSNGLTLQVMQEKYYRRDLWTYAVYRRAAGPVPALDQDAVIRQHYPNALVIPGLVIMPPDTILFGTDRLIKRGTNGLFSHDICIVADQHSGAIGQQANAYFNISLARHATWALYRPAEHVADPVNPLAQVRRRSRWATNKKYATPLPLP